MASCAECVLTLLLAFISGHRPQEVGLLRRFVFRVLQEMHYANLLICYLVKKLRAGGIALWPQATLDYMLMLGPAGGVLPCKRCSQQCRAAGRDVPFTRMSVQELQRKDTEQWRVKRRRDSTHDA